MQVTLTAIYEPQPDGWVVASIAEIPGVHTQGRTVDEARENLADALALVLEGNRDLAIAEASTAQRETFSFQIDLPLPVTNEAA